MTLNSQTAIGENLIGASQQQMQDVLASIGVPEKQLVLRTKQIFHWIYIRGATQFSQMASIGKDLQTALAQNFTLDRPEIVTEQISIDGTRKWLLRFPQARAPAVEVETVYIPESDRGTLCVSSQVGCSFNCSFCYTGTQQMMKNLTPSEILAQVMVARDRLADYSADGSLLQPPTITTAGLPATGRKVSNIVMMGMGEPLLNFKNVKQALLIALDDDGLGFSRRRITLSTSGVVPGIARTGEELKVALAISLHAVRDELRDELVPINRKYPIKDLLNACRQYPGLSNARRITFEYVMLKGVNDSMEDAQELVRLLEDIPSKINLIPFNPWPGTPYECSDELTIAAFAGHLHRNGYSSPIRATRGQDIMAACGQLKSETVKLS